MTIPGELLTPDEHLAMATSAELANLMRKIIGDGPEADFDWAEALYRIHAVEQMILAQAASRAFPDRYRPLGGWDAADPPEGEPQGDVDPWDPWPGMNGKQAGSRR